jgi:putative ABC transport system permease protein
VLGYASTLTRSLDATLLAKAKTFIGSDLAVGLGYEQPLPDDLTDRATVVETYRRAFAEVGGEDEEVTLIAVDTRTFARDAYWDDSFADESLAEIVDRLGGPLDDGNIPAVVVGGRLPEVVELNERQGRTSRFSISQVAHPSSFPGMRRSGPTVFVAAEHLAELEVDSGFREAWVRGDPDEALAVLEATDGVFTENRALADVADRASFLTVAWTFDFSQALALVAGVLVLGIVVVYLDARRRGRVLGYAFARRMGLTRAEHRAAVVAELVASVVVGCGAGLAIALAGATLTTRRIDPVPGYSPDPLLRPATATIVGVLVVAVLVAGLGGVLAQRRTDRDDPVEVLRAGV